MASTARTLYYFSQSQAVASGGQAGSAKTRKAVRNHFPDGPTVRRPEGLCLQELNRLFAEVQAKRTATDQRKLLDFAADAHAGVFPGDPVVV